MARQMTGGCQCGRVRYVAEVEHEEAYLCHCRMCQRATGGVSVAFKNLPRTAVQWESGREADWYQSSPIARRPFCSRCGTALGFAYLEGPNIDLTIGSFDEPGYFRPVHHFGAESMHEAWLDTSNLPRYRCDENEALVERWMTSVGKLPG